MEFKEFKQIFQDNCYQILQSVDNLFEVEVNKDELWDLYLDSFPEGTNEIFRERREYDCSACRQFIKNFGNVVAIKDNQIKTIWDFEVDDNKFQTVINSLDAFIKSKPATDVYFSKFNNIGLDKNRELLDDGTILMWEHLFIVLPDKFVNKTNKSLGDIKGDFRDTRNVFQRSLEEITEDSVLTVLELISQNSLYKGEEWKSVLTEFLKHKKEYSKLQTQQEKDNYAWEQSIKVGTVVGRIKNHSIGTLLTNISKDMELDTAVTKYEKIVAPENYKRPKAIFTKKMLEDARKTIEELGYIDSLGRRYATLNDISVNNILFSNKDSAKKMLDFDIFDEMLKDVNVNPKKYSKLEEISIDDFVNNVLPMTEEIEALFENKHSANMVSLIAPENKESKTMFKWNNNFSWAYAGNITDSSMKENVKMAGGNVEGVLRFSIQWNDDEYNPNDFDAHCIEPWGNEIYYGNKGNRNTSGFLDIDIINPERNIPAVENITWTNRDKMQEGNYRFFVHNYTHCGGRSGFKAEIEYDGQIHEFAYNKELRQGEKVGVADVEFNKDTGFTIKEKIPSSLSNKEIWNLKTNQFIPVSVIMYSPNYWDEQQGIGHRHYFFMLKDSINPENPNGMFNEFLNNELSQHKRVMEALGSKMRVEDSDQQLSGIGFSSTRRNDLVVKVKGSIERILKVKF